MKMLSLAAGAVLLAGIATPAIAGLSYNYVELGAERATRDSAEAVDIEGEGYGFELLAATSKTGFFEAGFNRITFTDDDAEYTADAMHLGIGAFAPSGPQSHFVLSLGLLGVNTEATSPGISESTRETGYYLRPGIRAMASENLELDVFMTYADIDDAIQKTITANALYHLTNNTSLSLGYSSAEDVEGYGLGLRFAF